MNTSEYIIKKFNVEKPKFGTEVNGSRKKELLEIIKELDFKVGVEIGVEFGSYSEEICIANPQLKLYSIDPWKAYPTYREHLTQSKIDSIYEAAKLRLKPYNCKIIRDFSEKAYKKFDNESVDFIYIDGNHEFLNVAQDIALWMPKLKKGGIMAGHDYIRRTGEYGLINNVKDVVPAYAYAKGITVWYILRETKPNGPSSWFWVK